MPRAAGSTWSVRARCSRWLGGAVLTALALMSVASIAGRALFSRPLQGDYELVQTGCAIFVALCLPYCQLKHANIIVDFFTTKASARSRRRLDAFGALLRRARDAAHRLAHGCRPRQHPRER